MATPEHTKQWRQEHLEAGLCIECCEKAAEDKIRCEHHLNLQLEHYRRRRDG